MTTIAAIQVNVAASFRIPLWKMREPFNRGRGRDGRNIQKYHRPRQVAMYFAREMTEHSLPRIGYYFGGRDHTTVITAIERITKLIATDEEFARKVDFCRDMIITAQYPRYPQGKGAPRFFARELDGSKVAA